MITITQFTLPQLRAAHLIVSAARPAPSAPTQSPEAPAAAKEGAPEPAASPEADNAAGADATASAEAAPTGPSPELVAELVEKLPLAENKVPYILGALKVAGQRIQKLRQVRVVQLEGAPANAVKLDEAAYILDLLPDAGNKGGKGGRSEGRDGDRRGGKGGKGRGNDGKKPGDRRGPGGAGGKSGGGDRPQGGRGPGRPGGSPTPRG